MNPSSSLSYKDVPLLPGMCIHLGAHGGRVTSPNGEAQASHPGRKSASGTQLPPKSAIPSRPVREFEAGDHFARFEHVEPSFRTPSNKAPWKH